MCGSEVRHRAVLKVMERDADEAAAADGSPHRLQPVCDVMSQSVPTDFVFSSPVAVNQIYNSQSDLNADVRLEVHSVERMYLRQRLSDSSVNKTKF